MSAESKSDQPGDEQRPSPDVTAQPPQHAEGSEEHHLSAQAKRDEEIEDDPPAFAAPAAGDSELRQSFLPPRPAKL